MGPREERLSTILMMLGGVVILVASIAILIAGLLGVGDLLHR